MYSMGGGPQAGGGMMGPSIMDEARQLPTAQDVPGVSQGMDPLDGQMQQAVTDLKSISGRLKFQDEAAANAIDALSQKLEKIRLSRKEDLQSAMELAQAQQVITRMP